MGDRGQIKIKMDEKEIYLYTHWGGSDMNAELAAALDRGRGRWGDTEYLARIIFCEMLGGDTQSLTGHGIGVTKHGDIEHPIPEIDDDNQTVSILTENGVPTGKTYTYEEFIKEFKGK